MGNFTQHLLWSLILLVTAESLVIYYLFGDYFLTILILPLFFLWGSIMPDVDLPRDKWWRSVLFNIILPVGAYFVGKYATHWGRVHSLGFGMVLCIPQYLFLGWVTGDYATAAILTVTFWCGYIFHLIVDQTYHYWRTGIIHKRRALKLWSNNWWI